MRVGIINDLPLVVDSIRLILERSGRHAVAWVAADGGEAISLCGRDRPDLLLMDLDMPGMDGVTATRRIMQDNPCPILIATGSVGQRSAGVFEALGAGAIDAVNTPVIGSPEKKYSAAVFLQKLDTIAQLIQPASLDLRRTPERRIHLAPAHQCRQLVAIGSSAGGPSALAAILGALPSDFPACVVIIQHLDEQFAPGLAEWLSQKSHVPVRPACPGDRPAPGVAFLASSADHLAFTSPGILGYTSHPRQAHYRPSVDVFFDSVIRHWDGDVLGVVLTGMGRDGARGLKALRDAGHHTIAQDRATSAVYGMPKAAAELDAAIDILPLDRISPRLVQRLTHHP